MIPIEEYPPSYESVRLRVAEFSAAHPHRTHFEIDVEGKQPHRLKRLGTAQHSRLRCVPCNAEIKAPILPRPEVTGIAASASRFD